jgi:2-polyprenyl-6-methoxyphenol hydroxylase-like FAD-dependent oxidoreductase
MFLEEIQQEEEKAFLELASLMAAIDGNQSIYENSILKKYQKEMKLENYRIKGLAMGDILKIFKNERSKNIVLTEIFKLSIRTEFFMMKKANLSD